MTAKSAYDIIVTNAEKFNYSVVERAVAANGQVERKIMGSAVLNGYESRWRKPNSENFVYWPQWHLCGHWEDLLDTAVSDLQVMAPDAATIGPMIACIPGTKSPQIWWPEGYGPDVEDGQLESDVPAYEIYIDEQGYLSSQVVSDEQGPLFFSLEEFMKYEVEQRALLVANAGSRGNLNLKELHAMLKGEKGDYEVIPASEVPTKHGGQIGTIELPDVKLQKMLDANNSIDPETGLIRSPAYWDVTLIDGSYRHGKSIQKDRITSSHIFLDAHSADPKYRLLIINSRTIINEKTGANHSEGVIRYLNSRNNTNDGGHILQQALAHPIRVDGKQTAVAGTVKRQNKGTSLRGAASVANTPAQAPAQIPMQGRLLRRGVGAAAPPAQVAPAHTHAPNVGVMRAPVKATAQAVKAAAPPARALATRSPAQPQAVIRQNVAASPVAARPVLKRR